MSWVWGCAGVATCCRAVARCRAAEAVAADAHCPPPLTLTPTPTLPRQATLPLAVADGGAARRLKQAQALDRAVLTVPAGCLRFDHAEEMFKE